MSGPWIKKPTRPGFYWCRGERKSQIAIAHVGERIVFDHSKGANISAGWFAQLTPGGVSLPLDSLPTYEYRGPIEPPTD